MRTGRASRSAVLTAAVLALLTAGCAPTGKKPVGQVLVPLPAPTKADGWRGVATDADEGRLQRLPAAWTEALQEARKFDARGVRDEGDLLRPDAALPRPALTPGSYYCRLVKLGRTRTRAPAFGKFKPFFCFVDVEGDLLTLVKQTGDTRPAGRLWEDDDAARLIFLGSVAQGAEKQPKAYGDDPKRDTAGVLERIGLFRWRLVVPWPQGTSKLDIYELTPVENQPE
ncbi:DUF4893 domain-containing protein [Sphingomonas piscis]|uniref:DUF4893 domain-containing protein n=1 Tax=Sphingomonas piscis TaxID=2714943 RepID=A0A6G7YP16_9SPHN|nr:DUF4893 domain-containing protein [Sphingomonas piscis]QIK78488.1 DUF4893 domain-containing protein [Sphingomonas piscis]